MQSLPYFFAAVALLAAALAALTLRARRRPLFKVTALGLAMALMTVFYVSAADLLGRPKAVGIEYLRGRAEQATVVAAKLDEGRAIYVWLALEGASEPRAYVLPWDEKRAREMMKAKGEVEAKGGELRMRRPFDPDRLPTEPMFYPAPQPALPPKLAEGR